jgi:hypothetical protein
VDVRGSRQAGAVGFIDHDPQGGQVVLGLVGPAAGGEVPPAHHDLDDVAAPFGALTHRRPQSGLVLGLAPQEVAVPADGRDRRASRDDARKRGCRKAPGEVERQVVPVAQVADRGHPRAQGPDRRSLHAIRKGIVVARRQRGDHVGRGIEGKMHVSIDEPGQQARI